MRFGYAYDCLVLLLGGDGSPKEHVVQDQTDVIPYDCLCGLIELEPNPVFARSPVPPTRVNGSVYFARVKRVLHNFLLVSGMVDSDDFCQCA